MTKPNFCLPDTYIFSEENSWAQHLSAQVVSSAQSVLPTDKRVPFGWQAAAIGAEPLVLHWPDLAAKVVPTHLRLTVALDVRDEKLIEVVLPQSGRVIGTFDVRFAFLFQIYELPLTANDVNDIRREGVALRLTKGSELWVFTANAPTALLPHLLVPGEADALAEFFKRMPSLATLQGFGWMEGCVLDGLLDLSSLPQHETMKAGVHQHLAQFLPNDELVYENPRSVPRDGDIYGIEGTLPFAALAQLEPEHPTIEKAIEFWLTHQDIDKAIIDDATTTSEGAYTVGYPLAILGRQRNNEEWQQLALTQLRIRHARLFDGSTFWRISKSNGDKGNRNWARGIAWQLLGSARTSRELKSRSYIGELVEQFQELANWSLQFQQPDGLWSVFVDEPQLSPDTAGSAGIAAALAIGAGEGWLDDSARVSAQKTLAALQSHLTADGFLGGVSQSNKGGEALQRSDYRVLCQMAMGLMAQLIAALEHQDNKADF